MTGHPHDHSADDGVAARDEGLHVHEHEHDGLPAHTHAHHHGGGTAPFAGPHEHAHTIAFERHAYLSSPLHGLDARAKIVAGCILVVAVVASAPLRPVEFALLTLTLIALTLAAHLPLGTILARTALVLPFAGAVALFAPLARSGGSWNLGGLAGAYGNGGWIAAYAVVTKAWLAVFCVTLLVATTTVPHLLDGLRRLKVPALMLMMLSFIYRYVDVLRDQLHAMRRAVASRAPSLRGSALIRLYGNLAGSMFVRSYERAERVYAAMASRGYDGTLPVADRTSFGAAGVLTVATAMLAAAAMALY